MTTFKFPEEHVPHRKGKFIYSCQWSESWSSRYGLAARSAVPFTPSQIKLCWEGQDRENPGLIEVEREPEMLPSPVSAQSSSKNRMEVAVSPGVEAPQPAGNPRLWSLGKITTNYGQALTRNTWTFIQAVFSTGTAFLGMVTHRRKKTRCRLGLWVVLQERSSQPGNLLWGNS